MTTNFKTRFERDGVPALQKEYAEDATYMPEGGGSRAIKAHIERQRVAAGEFAGESFPVWIVKVENSATTGISSAELNRGGDKISFPPREGETAETKSIVELLSHENGFVTVECR